MFIAKSIHFKQLLNLFFWKYLKFTRPKNLIINGKLIFNRYSNIHICKHSQLIIDGDLDIHASSLKLVNSKLHTGKLVMDCALIDLQKSQINLHHSSHLKNTSIHFNESNLNALENFRLHGIDIHAKKSNLNIGNYFFGQNAKGEILKWNFNKASFQVGNNTRLQCTLFQNTAQFIIGSNTFINAGTSISCINHIEIGDYVMISYDCLIFDNNSHALDYKIRRQEIDNGFPNGTLPNENNQPLSKPIRIYDDVWIGTKCNVLKGVTIGAKSVVASNTLVTKTVGELLLVYGYPNKYKPILIE